MRKPINSVSRLVEKGIRATTARKVRYSQERLRSARLK
jgi:hypothetical protein